MTPIKKPTFLVTAFLSLATLGDLQGQQFNHNQEKFASGEITTLKVLTAIELRHLFKNSRADIKNEFLIDGSPLSTDGYVNVRVYGPSESAAYDQLIAHMRSDDGEVTFPLISGVAGNEIKQNIQGAKTFGIYCKHLESYRSTFFLAGTAAAATISALGLFTLGGYLELTTGGMATPAAVCMVKIAALMGSAGTASTGAMLHSFSSVYRYNARVNEMMLHYEDHFKDGNTVCGLPDPHGNVIVEIEGQDFYLISVDIPGIPTIHVQDFLPSTEYSITITTEDGVRLHNYGEDWMADPGLINSQSGPLKLVYILPTSTDNKVFPSSLLGPLNNSPTHASVSVGNDGDGFLVLSDPGVFVSSGLSWYNHQDLGPILVNVESAQQMNGAIDIGFTLNLFRIFNDVPGEAIEFNMNEYGPFVFADQFTNPVVYNDVPVRCQGEDFEIRPLTHFQTLANGAVNTGNLEPELWGREVLDLKQNSSAILTLIRPPTDASLYAIVADGLVDETCNRYNLDWGCNCVDLGKAFDGYQLIRLNNFPPPEELSEEQKQNNFIQIEVNQSGPFLISPLDYRMITNEDKFDAVGSQFKLAPPGESTESHIIPMTWLGSGEGAYQIISMAESYYDLAGAIPTFTVQLTGDYGKAFSQQPDFLVAAVPGSVPLDWLAEDRGEFFLAEKSNEEQVMFHLYKISDAEGKLFTITNEGPYFVGTDGSRLDVNYPQFNNLAEY